MNHPLYCEFDFLIDFFDNRPKSDPNSTFREKKIELWEKYSRLFMERSNIYFDISGDDFYKKPSHPFIHMLKKKKSDGEIKFKFDKFPDDFENLQNQHAIFFLADPDACDQKEKEYGLIFLSTKDLFNKANYLFPDNIFYPINKNTPNWRFLEKHKHPCNFMLIIDKFLLKKESICSENLKSLFDVLLPDRIKKTFSITIRTKKPTKEDKHWEEWKDKIECDNWKNEIESYFESLVYCVRKKADFPVQIEFEEVNYSVHDRHLVTNYYWLPCGYGYALSDDEKQKGTDLHIHHISQLDVLKRMSELINKSTES